jgi:diguanylate cyclase (GGDEF)-like protein
MVRISDVTIRHGNRTVGLVGGGMLLAGGVLSGILALVDGRGALPDDAPLYAVTVAVALAAGLVCVLLPARLPPLVLRALPVVGAALICADLALLRTAGDGGELLLIWPVMFACYFLSTRVAWITVAAVLAMYTPIAIAYAGTATVTLLLAVAVTVVLTLLVVTSLRRSIVDTLISARAEAHTDALTGLLTRRAFDEALEREVLRSARDRRSLAVLLIDIDHFKRLNDTDGHQAGDEALRRLGVLLLGEVRRTDIVARYGGEEFCVLLPDCGSADADAMAMRICGHLREESRSWPSPLTVSIGVTTTPPQAADPLGLVAAADRALYDAKAFGRDTVYHAPDPNPPSAFGWRPPSRQ